MQPLRIEGYFTNKREVDSSSKVLDRSYAPLIKTVDLSELEILEGERIFGSFWKPVYVVGVMPTKGPATVPFYIQKEKVSKLKHLIEQHRKVEKL
jgi:hypothetical protein